MTIKLITAAGTGVWPVTAAEFKRQLKAEELRDEDVEVYFKAACLNMEAEIGYPILHSTWDVYSECWPHELPHNQVSAVSSIKYTPAGGEQTTVSTSIYQVLGLYDETDAVKGQYVGQARVILAYGQCWPSVTLDAGEPIVTRIVSGWKDQAAIPEDLKIGIMMEAAHLYRNRESVTVGNTAVESKALARGVDHFIARYRRWKF